MTIVHEASCSLEKLGELVTEFKNLNYVLPLSGLCLSVGSLQSACQRLKMFLYPARLKQISTKHSHNSPYINI